MDHLTYYLSLCGDWSGELRFAFTSRPEAWREVPKAWLLGAMGHVGFHTTLRRVSDTEMAHTTRAERLGITLFASEERFVLDPDGHRFVLRGTQREWPGFPEFPLEGDGEVHGGSAIYRFPWLGAPMTQRTQIVDEGLRIRQETAFSTAEVLLRRR